MRAFLTITLTTMVKCGIIQMDQLVDLLSFRWRDEISTGIG